MTTNTLTVDVAKRTLTISGPTETMDAIPDAELDAAAAEQGLSVDWARGPIDETTYAMVEKEG